MIRIKINKNWREKTHPYWFARRYSNGFWTFQMMALEVFRGKRRTSSYHMYRKIGWDRWTSLKLAFFDLPIVRNF